MSCWEIGFREYVRFQFVFGIHAFFHFLIVFFEYLRFDDHSIDLSVRQSTGVFLIDDDIFLILLIPLFGSDLNEESQALLRISASVTLTLRIPFSSMSKVTSIPGSPRGAGLILVRSNWPRKWLSFVLVRSPSNTRMPTVSWLSLVVVYDSVRCVGIGVFRGITADIIPSLVSIPIVNGLTSSTTIGGMHLSPESIPAWIAAPWASSKHRSGSRDSLITLSHLPTASSGLMLRAGSFPSKYSLRISRILGMRVDPPTRRTSAMSDFSSLASFIALFTGTRVDRKRSMFSSSNFARVKVSPKSSCWKKDSISIFVRCSNDKVRFAFSTSRRSFSTERMFLPTSLPTFLLNNWMKWLITRWSKSSPPTEREKKKRSLSMGIQCPLTQMCVAIRRQNFKNTVIQCENRNIESSTAQVEH